MKTINSIILLFMIAAFLSCENTNEPEQSANSGEVELTVLNSNMPVKNSKVFLNETDFKGISDSYGKVLFSGVPEGIYEAFAYYEGYGSGKETVEVKRNTLNKADILFTLGIFIEPRVMRYEPYSNYKSSVNDTVTFRYNITDNETASENIQIRLSSSLDGELASTNLTSENSFIFKSNSLSKGEHVIRLEAEDSDGYVGRDSVVVKNIKPPRVVLSAPTVINEGVKLEWSVCSDPDFNRYEIIRNSNPSWNDGQKIGTVTGKQNTSFVDTAPPFTDSIYYKIVSYTNDEENSSSEYLKVKNPAGHIYRFAMKDAVIHPDLPYIYLATFNGEVILYDYEKEQVIQKKTYNTGISFLEIGDNGFGIELYVPDYSGFIHILDPLTLNELTFINCGNPVTSVAIDGKGIVYAGIEPSPWWENPVRSFSRSEKSEIDGAGRFAEGRVRLLPDKKTLIEITSSSSPVNMEYFEVDENGNFTFFKEDQQHGDHPLSYITFKVAGSGEFVITSTSGTMYKADSTMEYLGELSSGEIQFSDFIFDDNQKMYASSSNNKSIYVYSVSGFNQIDNITTKGYPFKIFLKGNKIIAVSKTIVAYYWENSGVIFESFSINN